MIYKLDPRAPNMMKCDINHIAGKFEIKLQGESKKNASLGYM